MWTLNGMHINMGSSKGSLALCIELVLRCVSVKRRSKQTSPNISWKGVGLTIYALRGHVSYGTSEGMALQQTNIV